ncbi:MAG: hypothetical protein WCL21_00935 [Mariniphaga sp.]
MKLKYSVLLIITLFCLGSNTFAQISPGELTKAHAALEGVSNCTKCHAVGDKVTNEKCLDCHKEIRQLINSKRGFHVSSEVAGKNCFVCHNDHHGRNFQIIKFDKTTFNHLNAGFELKGAHAKEDCKACNCKSCHKPAFIKDPELKKKPSTYLGLGKECLSCHDDFHKGKMAVNCTTCHGFDSFKNATGFDHNTTKFPLIGKHKNVDCAKCHKTEIINGKQVRQLEGLVFNNCTSCHKDIHENKFGQNCKQCHTEESFHTIKGIGSFDHNKTDFKLEGKHMTVACKSCHKTSLTAPIKHDHCYECHTDYHKKEFVKDGIVQDCDKCHSNSGFAGSTFTIEKHNLSKFRLEGAHLATPCFACHKKQENWKFRSIGSRCVDCHRNEHKGFIQDKYYQNENCTECHHVENWKSINFDHSKTKFRIEGAHIKQSCTACHYSKNKDGQRIQKFTGISEDCSGCHKDPHTGQFEAGGKTTCTKCHGSDDWKKCIFDHNSSRFKLDGAHLKVKCEKCHKEVITAKGKYIEYKNNKLLCADCHR